MPVTFRADGGSIEIPACQARELAATLRSLSNAVLVAGAATNDREALAAAILIEEAIGNGGPVDPSRRQAAEIWTALQFVSIVEPVSPAMARLRDAYEPEIDAASRRGRTRRQAARLRVRLRRIWRAWRKQARRLLARI
jgi:hypothetical protein